MRKPPRIRALSYVVAASLAAILLFAPTPYSLILPGSAIDVRDVLTVAGRSAPVERYFMTDVTLQERVAPILLLEKFIPGTRMLRTEEVIPQGISVREFDEIMKRSMDESQSIAAVVAERAAHLPVGIPVSQIAIVRFEATSGAPRILRAGDILRSVNGHIVATTMNVQDALFHVRPGAKIDVQFERGGKIQSGRVPTMQYKGKTRLGVFLIARFRPPHLPVDVRFKPFNVAGSSGGLMFAMDIFRTLVPANKLGVQKIAGTGTLSYEGIVGPIDGAPQKLIAARRAGAQIFFVPKENYQEIANTRDIKIIPVHTFKEALAALPG
ncbi:MAG: PDZ domain-containing protein [Candidatus Eremiobacteraeota bacterium]|nr:PDZ domain-containing protein [Candidatus Eremiobacteraeota bacterium]